MLVKTHFHDPFAPVADPAAVDACVAATLARFGRLDIVVNNAGITAHSPALTLDIAEWDHIIQTNARGAFLVARAVVKCGLGERIGHAVVSRFGRSTLGLSYSLFLVDAVIAPAFPSNTARSGVIYSLAASLAETAMTTNIVSSSAGRRPKKKAEVRTSASSRHDPSPGLGLG
jgi:NAD(P)-dependent dehydrogenase (short-subunit alcohol dehydrogenase family)